MMDERLIKSYDIIKEEQRNADNKANLFIILITAFLSFYNKIDVGAYTPEQIEGMNFVYLIIILPLLLLVFSLFPIYKHSYKRFKKKTENIDFNIFYWRSISNLENDEILYNKYLDAYGCEDKKTLTLDEKHILSQIRVNAEILERKTYLHKRAFYIIGQLLLIFMISVFVYFIARNVIVIFLISLSIIEILLNVFLFKWPKFLFQNIEKSELSIKNRKTVKCKIYGFPKSIVIHSASISVFDKLGNDAKLLFKQNPIILNKNNCIEFEISDEYIGKTIRITYTQKCYEILQVEIPVTDKGVHYKLDIKRDNSQYSSDPDCQGTSSSELLEIGVKAQSEMLVDHRNFRFKNTIFNWGWIIVSIIFIIAATFVPYYIGISIGVIFLFLNILFMDFSSGKNKFPK